MVSKIRKQTVPSQYLFAGGYASFSSDTLDGFHYYIQESGHVVDNKFQVQDGIATICINLDEGLITTKGIYMSPATCAGHEFGHADSYDKAIHGKGEYQTATGHPENVDSQYGSKEEKRNIEQTEQKMARKHQEIIKGQKTREDHTHLDIKKFNEGQSFEEMSEECRNNNINNINIK